MLQQFRRLLKISMMVVFLVIPNAAYGEDTEYHQAKEKIVNQIHQNLAEMDEAIKHPFPPEITSPSISPMSLQDWKIYLQKQRRQMQSFLKFVQTIPEERLPFEMVSLFVKEYPSREIYPSLEVYLLTLGELTISAFNDTFPHADPRVKEKILVFLGGLHSRKALPLVREALNDENQRVILTAQTALRLILKLEAKPELEQMLVGTKSSWAIKSTLHEIVLLGGTDWYEAFFRLIQSGKLSLRDLAEISSVDDCPEDVVGQQIPYLLKIINSADDPRISASDLAAMENLLLSLKFEKENPLLDLLLSNFDSRDGEAIKNLRDATELTGAHESAIIQAFNRTKDDLQLYPRKASSIQFKNTEVTQLFEQLAAEKIFLKTDSQWTIKHDLKADEQNKIKWFNIALLRQEFPSVLIKSKDDERDCKIAVQLLSKLSQPEYIKQLSVLLTQLINIRYKKGGIVYGFSEAADISRTRNQFSFFEADLLLKKLVSSLTVDDIQQILQDNDTNLLKRLFLWDILAKQSDRKDDLPERSFYFRIEVWGQSNDLLASSDYSLALNEEKNVVLPSNISGFPTHNIKLSLRLDRDKWMFRFDPVLIDLKPYAAGFQIYIPISGMNETILNELVQGQRENFKWRFKHLEK